MTDSSTGPSTPLTDSAATLKQRLAALSPEKLAALQQRLRQRGSTGYQAIGRGPEATDHPLSFHQQRLWFIEQLQPGLALYNVNRAMRIRGALNYAALQAALQALFDRHESLRTTFHLTDGEPVQRIEPRSKLELPIEDLSHPVENGEDIESRLQRRLTAESRRVFDLTADPMMRARLFRLTDEEHVLEISIHHLVCDGWSLDVLFRELNELYSAFAGGQSPELPTPSLRYVDFARWQREPRQRDLFSQRTAWWKQKMSGAATVLDLPADRPRPQIESGAGDIEPLHLSPSLLKELEALGQEENATLFMVLLAGFWMVLHRQSGLEEFLIASATAGRQRPETHDIVGFFVDTVVLRADLTGEPTARDVVRRARDTLLEAMNYSDVPFERVVESMTLPRDLSRHSLFQVMFNAPPQYTLKLHDLEVSPVHVNPRTSRFDLEMTYAEGANRLTGMVYNTDLYDAESIQRLLSQYRVVLEGIVADADRRVSELPLLTESERTRMLVDWNDTFAEYPREACLHQLFEQQTEKTPDAAAVRFEDQAVTYRDLNIRANQLAHRLREFGVGPEDVVGLCLDRSPEVVVGILGILKAGGAYLPLDADVPRQRLDFMLRDAAVSHLVTVQGLLDRLPPTDGVVICLDRDAAELETCERSNPAVAVASHNLIYVMFTSGSTGTPKGVAIEQHSVVNLLFGLNSVFRLGPGVRFLGMASPTFDISVAEMFLPLVTGATTILVSKATAQDPQDLVNVIAATQPRFVQATPASWASMLETGWRPAQEMTLITGGEALSRSLATRLLETGCELYDCYGPTETTIWSTVCRKTAGNRFNSIGRPIANTQVYVLDAHRRPTPIGVPGELYIGGEGLARGYLNRPELNAEKFVSNPFRPDPPSRLYRTGDLCCWSADGQLEFHGRSDHQVKLRGHRIELGEIESVLGEHPCVTQSVVMLRKDRPGDERLTAYCVPAAKSALPIAELKSHLRSRVPEYMVPSVFVELSALPLTSNGKVNRQALPLPDDARPDLETGYVAPCTAVEQRLAKIWRETLGIDKVGLEDDFFDLGGHSLLAVKLFARIEQEFGRKLPLATLFQHGSISHFARLLDESAQDSRLVRIIPLRPVHGGRPLFVMPSIAGELLYSRPLIERLSAQVSVMGIQPALDAENLELFRDFRRTAEHFVQALRERQPRGPYALLGYSYGGFMAYEAACLLREQGETVEVLAVIDTGPGYRGIKLTLGERCLWCARVVANFPRWVREELRDFSPRRLSRSAYRKLRHVSRRIRSAGRAERQFDDAFDAGQVPSQNQELMRVVFAAFRDYRPRHFAGHLTLLRARTRPLFSGAPRDLGWSRLTDSLEICDIDGNHESILHSPNLEQLASALDRSLVSSPANRQ